MSSKLLQLDRKEAGALSLQLRKGNAPHLRRRRGIVGLSLVAMGSMAVISLYQMGIVRHLPEPPLPGFNADKVDAAPEAYQKFSSPDAVLGLGSYATTAALAAMGGEERVKDHPWLPLALAGKIGLDAAQALKLSWDQWAKHRAFCSWCLLAAGAALATVPLIVPEAQEALRRLRQGQATLEQAGRQSRATAVEERV